MNSFYLQSVDGVRLHATRHPAQSQTARGSVICAHGITVDMDEEGTFIRLADHLADSGFDVLRFSFRGHGNSGGTQSGITIAGEMLDLQAAIKYTKEHFNGKLTIIAASFGAVSVCLSLPFIENELKGLVLWYPVLDLKRTVIKPELPWGKQNFTGEGVRQLQSRGYMLLDERFAIGRVLWEEMKHYQPHIQFTQSSVPAIIIHGDADTYVPYAVSQEVCKKRPNCRVHTIQNSDHGFDEGDHENKAIHITVDWLEDVYHSSC